MSVLIKTSKYNIYNIYINFVHKKKDKKIKIKNKNK